MIRLMPKVVLLMALLTTLVSSSFPAFALKTCTCLSSKCVFGGKGGCPSGGCRFDTKTSQCVNTGCDGTCYFQ
jgi:hypothetical protein